MKLTVSLKDYEIAREMFGTHTKQQCKIVKKLRGPIVVEEICEGWSAIRLVNEECGWLISNQLLMDL